MRWVCLALLAALPPFAAHGEQPTSITLWCGNAGAVFDAARPDPITGGGMTVDFRERTVTFNSFRVPIKRADDTLVLFHGPQATRYEGLRLTVDGSIDLVTGGVSLTFDQVGNNTTWKLTCQQFVVF
jgi:hypothetical protein